MPSEKNKTIVPPKTFRLLPKELYDNLLEIYHVHQTQASGTRRLQLIMRWGLDLMRESLEQNRISYRIDSIRETGTTGKLRPATEVGRCWLFRSCAAYNNNQMNVT